MDTLEHRSEIPGKFRNVVLQKDGDQLDQLCYKIRGSTEGQGGQEYPTDNKNKEG
jgi:hypothetical protein